MEKGGTLDKEGEGEKRKIIKDRWAKRKRHRNKEPLERAKVY
jgi:hypothetical protein